MFRQIIPPAIVAALLIVASPDDSQRHRLLESAEQLLPVHRLRIWGGVPRSTRAWTRELGRNLCPQ